MRQYECECGFKCKSMKIMTEHIEEEGNICRKFVVSMKAEVKD